MNLFAVALFVISAVFVGSTEHPNGSQFVDNDYQAATEVRDHGQQELSSDSLSEIAPPSSGDVSRDCSTAQFADFISQHLESKRWQALFSEYGVPEFSVPEIGRTEFYLNGKSLVTCHMDVTYRSPVSPTTAIYNEKINKYVGNMEAVRVMLDDGSFISGDHTFVIGPHSIATLVADGPNTSSLGYGIETPDGLRMFEIVEGRGFTKSPYEAADPCPCWNEIQVTITEPLTESLLDRIEKQ